MRNIVKIAVVIVASFISVSCFNKNKPNYQFMPNMYEPVSYQAYGDYEVFPNGQEAMLPVEGTVSRGWMPYDYPNTTEGLNLAKAELRNPLDVSEKNLSEGKELYNIYCAICHGEKGDGQGVLVKREKFLGIPSYDDAGRNITEGGIYHVQMFGLNSMGSYASQTNELERWQITQHVMNLKAALKGEPLLSPAMAEVAPVEENVVLEEVTPSDETH
jgi:mono/diheme cytochrome c family protein